MDTTNRKLKLTLLLVSSLTIMSVITIAPALPEMTVEFREAEHADLLVRLAFTIPALMIAMMAPLTGRLIDRHGRLKMLWGALFFLCAFRGVRIFPRQSTRNPFVKSSAGCLRRRVHDNCNHIDRRLL